MIRAQALVVVRVLATTGGGWQPAVHASPASSWVPRQQEPRGHSKIDAALERRAAQDDTPIVVRVAGQPSEASAAVSDVGGTVRSESSDAVLAWVRPTQLSTLADDGRVQRISEPRRPRPTSTSEGVASVGASAWQSAGIDGSGVKLGIVDPRFRQLATEQAAGRLPLTAVTNSFCGGGLGGNTEHG